MTLTEHFGELRRRLLCCLGAVVLCAVPCGIFWRDLFGWIAIWPMRFCEPAPRLIFTAPADAMFFIFEIALTCGTVLASPVLFWQAWQFIAPGLYRREKAVAAPVVAASVFCFLSGAAFCYFFLPLFLRFLTGVVGGLIEPLFRINEYFGFLLKMCLVFGLAFELPVVSFILSRAGVIDYRFLRRNFRHGIVVIVVAGAVLTPTVDALSLLFFALPLVALYGASILISFAAQRGRKS